MNKVVATEPLPPLSMVRAFEAAARLSSFTRAADELHMTQAAVSYQIKQLERRLGLTLFQRLPRQVVLTAAGQRLAPAVLDAFRTLRTAFGQVHERAEHELAITSLPTIAATWLVPRLGAFQLAHPRLAVRLDTSVPTVDFSAGEFDVGLRSGRGDWPGLVADRLLPSLFTPLCSPQVRERLRTPADLLGLQRMGRERWWRQWFDAAGVMDADLGARPSIDLSVEQFEITSAVAGHGVAITSPLFFRKELSSGELVQPFDLILRDERDYWLVYPAGRRHSSKIQAFRTWLLEEVAQEPVYASVLAEEPAPASAAPAT
ncbi:LysR substrate-binding domain-containing protein [Luteimonas salinilitoris]|uniref:LysR substrate-binding domain-containing protein n=1 Tax=Luteimonas salinilitoris TaxID=3237697 RepID=A0ABV4HNM0_9GAMM